MNSDPKDDFVTKRQALVSIAMLKVHYDERRTDYVEYLAPFVFRALRGKEGNPISAYDISQTIREQSSLVIPTNTVELFLRRLARKDILRRDYDAFWINKPIPDDTFASTQQPAAQSIDAVSAELQKYVKDELSIDWNQEQALSAIHAYLNRFGVECLSSFARRSILPDVKHKEASQEFCVNKFIQALYQRQDSGWDSMYVLVRAHMFSNALLCPDLESLQKTFTKLTTYIDTRIILRLLGLEGPEYQAATLEPIDVLKKLDGKISIFSHTLAETDHVFDHCAKWLHSESARGSVIWHARKTAMRSSDLLLIRAQMRPRLSKLNISITPTPKYTLKYQIDETKLGEWLQDEVYFPLRQRAKEHDINCVRSIYVLRHGSAPPRLEDSKAVFVTTNTALARSAFRYGKEIESTREVSPVVTAFSLANIAWLKRPLEAGDLPKKEMLAMAFAAMQPSEQLWSKFLAEIDRMKEEALIDPRIHSIMRYDLRAREELMELTQGSDDALGPATAAEVVRRVEEQIRGEESLKLEEERQKHVTTHTTLEEERVTYSSHESRIYTIAHKCGKIIAWALFVFVLALMAVGAITATYFLNDAIRAAWPLKYLTLLVTTLFVFVSILGMAFGFTLKSLRTFAENWIAQKVKLWLWGRDSAS